MTIETAVIEARIEKRGEREWLVPVAPEDFVGDSSYGFFRNSFGGFVEVDGPARLLNDDEYKTILKSLSNDVKEAAQKHLVRLRTGEMVEKVLAYTIWSSLKLVYETNPFEFYEFAIVCRDPTHQLLGDYRQRLENHGLLQPHGRPHNAIRLVTLAAIQGEGLKLTMVNPFGA